MLGYRRFSTLQQMSASVAAFVLLALVLESGGLVDWAQRLDLGRERTVALPAVMGLHRALGWVGMERVRRNELVELARIGWSDDPEALALAREGSHSAAKVSVPPPGPARVVAMNDAMPVAVPSIPKMKRKASVGDPPLLSTLPEIPGVEAGQKRTVALVGDSMMAVGLSSTLLREAPKYPDLVMDKAFKSGTGLARPEVFNWQTEYPAMLGDARPDVVVVAIGANDGQGFVEGGVTYPFGSDGWVRIYRARVEAFLAMLQANGATVVWMGLPPMKSDVYDARIAVVNRIDYEVVSESPQAIWYSTAGIVGDGSGKFQDFGVVRGETARLRQQDGIHLSDDGAVLVVAKLLPWLAAQQQPESAKP
jgi:hypothetical protein